MLILPLGLRLIVARYSYIWGWNLAQDSHIRFTKNDLDQALAKAIVELDLYRVNRGNHLWATQAVLSLLAKLVKKDREKGKMQPPTIYLLMMASIDKRMKLNKNYASAHKYLARQLDQFTKFADSANGKNPDKKRIESAAELRDYFKLLRVYIKDHS